MIKMIKSTYGLVKADGSVEAMTAASGPFSVNPKREAELIALGVLDLLPGKDYIRACGRNDLGAELGGSEHAGVVDLVEHLFDLARPGKHGFHAIPAFRFFLSV